MPNPNYVCVFLAYLLRILGFRVWGLGWNNFDQSQPTVMRAVVFYSEDLLHGLCSILEAVAAAGRLIRV